MRKKYLVTGGAGFLGRSIVHALIQEGHSVTVLDNESRGAIQLLNNSSKNLLFIKGDIRDRDIAKKACKNVDTVLHLAYINGTENFYKNPDVVLDVAVKGITNILDGAIAEGVSEFFLASSSEVYNNPPLIPTPENVPLVIPDPFNPRYSYSGGKIISELLVIHNSRHFKKTVIFRPHNVYGPAMGFEHVIPQVITHMKKQKITKEISFSIQGDGKQSRSFIYIDDFTSGLMLLLKKAKNLEIYNVGTSYEITIQELVLAIAKLFNIKIILRPGTLTPGSPQRRCPDISKMQSLGFSEKVSLEEGLKKTIEWYINQ